MSSQGPTPNILSSPLDLDSEILLAHAFQINRLQLRLALADFRNFVKRRNLGEPVAYITGVQEFFGLDFEVNSQVLIPRPETEKLVELALQKLTSNRPLKVIDLGTGSGCIAISLAVHRPNIQVLAIDKSPTALEVAKRNAQKHGVRDRIIFKEGDLLEGISETYDLLISNPPYIRSKDMPDLMRDVRDFEPHLALEGLGENGIGLHEKILEQAVLLLEKKAFILLEIGYDQGVFFQNKGRIIQDDSGHDRIVEIQIA